MFCVESKKLGCIEVSGPDADSWLNRLLTNQVPQDKNVFGAARLDYKGSPQDMYLVVPRGDSTYLLLLAKSLVDDSFSRLESGIFAEDLALKKSALGVDWVLEFDPELDGKFKWVQKSVFPALEGDEFWLALEREGYLAVSKMEKNIFIEAPAYLEFVHDNKGCYPGQEVINKILSIGKCPREYCVFAVEGKTTINETIGDKLSAESLFDMQILHKSDFMGNSYYGGFVRKKIADELPETLRFTGASSEAVVARRYR